MAKDKKMPKKNNGSKVAKTTKSVPKGALGSGYAEKAAEAIRKNKAAKQKALKELGY